MHARLLAAWVAAITLTLVMVAYLGAVAARHVVAGSGFRLAMAAQGGGQFAQQRLDVAIGNSQLMDGLNAAEINRRGKGARFVNLAFNGLESPDIVAVLETFYRTCGCTVERLYVNASALRDELRGTSEFEVFMAAYNPDLLPRILDDQPSLKASLRFLPLLHFNNEVFMRSAYYWLRGHDDQAHGNSYRMKIRTGPRRAAPVNRAAEVRAARELFDRPRVERLAAIAREHRTQVVVVVPPFHPLYVEDRGPILPDYVAQLRKELGPLGIPVLDHSATVVTRPDQFADLIHMHRDGQSAYSAYFATEVLARR